MTEEQVGSLAEEAIRLARSLAAQAADGRRSAGGESAGETSTGAHATMACDYCPLCQLIALVRDARPDVVDHLESALVSLGLAARGVVEAWTSGDRATARTPDSEGEDA